MRSILALSLAASLCGQSMTTTFAGGATAPAGAAIYFDLYPSAAAGTSVHTIDLNLADPAGTSGTISVYTAPFGGYGWETTGPWTLLTTAPITSAGPGLPSQAVLGTSITVSTFDNLGVCIVANGLSHRYSTDYVSANGCPLELLGGTMSNTPFAGPVIEPAGINATLHFDKVCATCESQGVGCLTAYASIYEFVPAAAMDLTGKRVTGTWTSGGYVVTAGNGSPVATGLLGPTTSLILFDDSETGAGSFGVRVGSNCWIALGPGNSTDYVPSLTSLLGAPSTAFYSWNDLNPQEPGSGPILYEENAAGKVRVTYDGVYGFGKTTPNTIQIDYDTVTLEWSITWGALDPAMDWSWLVGHSPGGTSADPGPTDFSALNGAGVGLGATDQLPLRLDAVGGPLQLTGVQNVFEVTTSEIPPSALIHIGIVGLSRPGAPLDFIGMPGCWLWSSLEVMATSFLPQPPPTTFTWTPLIVPAAPPTIIGTQFNVQAAILGTNLNDALFFGALTSNGLKCEIGTALPGGGKAKK